VSVAKQFGDNLGRIRRRSGLSQEEVGWRASVHRTEVSQLERGLRVARVDTVAKLAAALEVDPGDFFEGIAWEPGDVRYGRFTTPNPPDCSD
jgi:XRE family transcriptional regulator, regulator of sulfur utilization